MYLNEATYTMKPFLLIMAGLGIVIFGPNAPATVGGLVLAGLGLLILKMRGS